MVLGVEEIYGCMEVAVRKMVAVAICRHEEVVETHMVGVETHTEVVGTVKAVVPKHK